jgi:MFS family permease
LPSWLEAPLQPTSRRHNGNIRPLSLFYIGPAVGILISGFVSPFLLEWLGPGTWWIVWGVLAAISASLALVLPQVRVEEQPLETGAARTKFEIAPVLVYLLGYFLFGAGYIGYMTFMIAYVRGHRRWCANAKYFLDLHRRRRTCPALGLGHVVGEKPRRRWYRTANRNYCRWSSAAAFWEITDSIRCFRAHLWQRVLCSGFVNTAFVRFNYLREAWPKAIAMMTVAFGIGQVLGPIAIGAITDKLGSLSYALNISAATLVLGALACICQRSITPRIESANYGRETSRALVRVTSALPSKADMRDREQHVR